MKRRQGLILFFFITALGFLIWKNNNVKTFTYNQGLIFGTSYHISYYSPHEKDYNDEIRQHLLDVVDNSLSTFNKNSIISKVNNNQEHHTDSAFEKVFITAQKIAALTQGAFDITVAPLVNRWGFGYSQKQDSIPSKEEITNLLSTVGYQNIRLVNHQVVKQYPETLLDGSAIAKGYAVDVAADFLKSKGITDFMVEIGGEIYVSGSNNQGKKWRVGIDRPVDDPSALQREIDTVLHISNMAIATSGNYRQFYFKGGKRFSHTIDPISGYPVNHSLLSATVIAPDCMTADALATACMVMGAQKGLALAEKLSHIEVYFIVDQDGEYKELFSSGINTYLSQNNK